MESIVWWWAVVATVVALLSVGLHILRSAVPLPIFDRGNAVVSFNDEKVMEVVLNAARAAGVHPVLDLGTAWQPTRCMTNSNVIFNLKPPANNSDGMYRHQLLQNVTGGWIFVSRTGDPASDASALSKALEAQLGSSERIYLLLNPDTTMPDNSMAFVLVRSEDRETTELFGFRKPMNQLPKPRLYRQAKTRPKG
ncbi:MAG: hypothetical protein CEO22_124 [Candidatus Berkelbacteria bacterium Gr01-1014_85]|uniref:Uncharacterized protein n=1 Tax=Candidatus Berkelbacteria bacterium Gr01-1014_85 TaxID=2017150 RepID=A0A554JDC6_9BACT|nr:MAG: hypothetical protein CEO22_124 [Candidatus Berkelbacteria bacterium Gr01-1014_85]